MFNRWAGVRLAAASLAVWCTMIPGHAAPGIGHTYLASPDGSDDGTGSVEHPLSLAVALGRKSPLRPGDTLWLQEGRYRGPFTSYLTGSAALPITVRANPGARVTIDGAASPKASTFVVRGAWTTYWGLEITNSSPIRTSGRTSRGTGLNVEGAHTRFINMVIHDALTGVGFWTPAVEAELYGSLIYNNGADGTDRGHGHSIYAQNETGVKRIVDNILFNSFSHGVHLYTEGSSIDNFLIDGNVSFDHGVSSAFGPQPDLLLGGRRIARQAVISNNFFYRGPASSEWAAEFGRTLPCWSARIERNVFAAARAVRLNCRDTQFVQNRVFGDMQTNWGSSYPDNIYLESRPSGVWTFVRPNLYEPGRSTIVVYNWEGRDRVALDVPPTSGLQIGERFEIRDAQNFFGAPVIAGVYRGGAIELPMRGLTAAQPLGNAPRLVPHTGPDFGVFILMSTCHLPPCSP